jgi:hypothetical protein
MLLCEADLLRKTRSSHDIKLGLKFLSTGRVLSQRSLSACCLRSLLPQGRNGCRGHTGPLFGIIPLGRVIFIELGDIRRAIPLLLWDIGVVLV